MINKKNQLGKEPLALGDKDAIHAAIVAVRAERVIHPGESIGINEHGEATNRKVKQIGVADPFYKGLILKGQIFWMMLDQTQISSVTHSWDHPEFKFESPTREIELNKYILQDAKELGVSYTEIMEAAHKLVYHNKQTPITASKEMIDNIKWYDFWYEWSEETEHEFPDYGTVCCPEREYPDDPPFACNLSPGK